LSRIQTVRTAGSNRSECELKESDQCDKTLTPL